MIVIDVCDPGKSRCFVTRPPEVESHVWRNSDSGSWNPYTCASHFCSALKMAKPDSLGAGACPGPGISEKSLIVGPFPLSNAYG